MTRCPAANHNVMPNKKARIEFIDLAKGFCILAVVMYHIFRTIGVEYPFEDLFSKIRMPLYFVLSGLFFKEYENFLGFFKRKTNKLLVPFVFFYLVLATPVMLYKGLAAGKTLAVSAKEALLGWYHEEFTNIPTWFLLSLFLVNLLFYAVMLLSRRFGDKYVGALVVLTLAVGSVGAFLGYQRIELPAFIDTSLTALPLYCLGYLLNRHSNILRKSKLDRYLLLVIPLMLAMAYLVDGRCNFITNHFWIHPLLFYPSCALAAVAVILLAKVIKHIPWVTYVGRYSIMLLIFHEPVYAVVIYLLDKCHLPRGYFFAFTTFVVTSAILTLLIPFCKKFLPMFTAQKDLIKVGTATTAGSGNTSNDKG